MTKEYQEALTEVNEILKFSNIDLVKKIPYRFKKFIETNMSKDYEITLDLDKPLNEQKIKEETKNILGLIYRDYISSNEEKHKIIEYQKNAIKQLEQEKMEKNNPDNLFENMNNIKTKEEKETTNLVIPEKRSLFKKFVFF